jgi:competence protein ComEC
MYKHAVPIWKSSPFIRLLLPLILGILVQYYISFDLSVIIFALASFSLALLLFRILPLSVQFKFQGLQGSALLLIIAATAALFTYLNDDRNSKSWYGNLYNKETYLIVKINEPVQEKTKSYKAEALVEQVIVNDSIYECSGKLLLYFEKDSSRQIPLHYGNNIIIKKTLQKITNSGNPGAFNYNGILHFNTFFTRRF